MRTPNDRHENKHYTLVQSEKRTVVWGGEDYGSLTKDIRSELVRLSFSSLNSTEFILVALHNDSVCPGEESVVPSQYVSSVASMAVTYCSVPLVTGVLDNSGGSSVASTQVTYVGVIPLGDPTNARTRRLSHPPPGFTDEQASGEHGSLKRSSSSTAQPKNKKGKGGSASDAEDHKKDKDDKGV
jgi:hypothetical protein